MRRNVLWKLILVGLGEYSICVCSFYFHFLFFLFFFNLSDILKSSIFFLHLSMFFSFYVAIIFYVWIENSRLKFCLSVSRFFPFFRKKRNISEPWNQRKLPDSCRKRKTKPQQGKKKSLWIISFLFFFFFLWSSCRLLLPFF